MENVEMYSCLVKMIKWTHEFQNKVLENPIGLSPKSWAKEFCSIKFCLPRQSGHTTFAKLLFEDVLENSLLIVPKLSYLRHIIKYYENTNGIGTVEDVKNGKFKGMPVNSIIVDCASLLSNADIDKLYDEFSQLAYNQKNFVFLFLE